MLRFLFLLVVLAVLMPTSASAASYDMGYQTNNKLWASAYEAFANSMGYDHNNEHWASSYEHFVTSIAASDTTSAVIPTTGWGILFPVVWLWRTLPFWLNVFAVLLIVSGFVWSPRGSHLTEAFFNAQRDFIELLKSLIPNPIDIHRVEKARESLALAQHQLSVAERITANEIELREAADHDREKLRRKLEESDTEIAELERKNRTLRRPLDIETLQLRIRELNQQLLAATSNINGKMEDAAAPLRRQIDVLMNLLSEKDDSIKVCHRSIARLEEAGKATQNQSKLDKNRIEGLNKINRESRNEIQELKDQVMELTREANSLIAARDKRLETLDAIKELLHQMIGQPDYFEPAMTFAFLASSAEIDLGELEIDPRKLDFLMDCVNNDITPTAEQLSLRRANWEGRLPVRDEQTTLYYNRRHLVSTLQQQNSTQQQRIVFLEGQLYCAAMRESQQQQMAPKFESLNFTLKPGTSNLVEEPQQQQATVEQAPTQNVFGGNFTQVPSIGPNTNTQAPVLSANGFPIIGATQPGSSSILGANTTASNIFSTPSPSAGNSLLSRMSPKEKPAQSPPSGLASLAGGAAAAFSLK